MNNILVASAASLPTINTVVSGVVMKVLRNSTPESSPHAVLVKFDGHVGMLRAKDMDAQDRMKSISCGDKVDAAVTKSTLGTDGKALIDLSETRLTMLTELHQLPGSHRLGTVIKTTKYGVFLDIGRGFPSGLCHVSELASCDRQERLQKLKSGDQLMVCVVSVTPDNVGDFRIELSEVEHYSRKLQHHEGILNGTILRIDEGVHISLANGVEGFMPVERMGKTDPSSLKKGMKTRVKVVGLSGRALLLSRDGAEFDTVSERAQKESKRNERRARDQDLRRSMQGAGGGGGSNSGNGNKGGKK